MSQLNHRSPIERSQTESSDPALFRRLWRAATVALLLLTLVGCQTEHPIAGGWQGEDTEGNEVSLIFENSGRFRAFAPGEQLEGSWQADLESTPHRITFSFDEGLTTTTIFKLQGNNMLIEPVVEHDLVPEAFTQSATVYRKTR